MSASGWSGSNYIQILDAVHPTQFTLAARVKLTTAASNYSLMFRSTAALSSAWSHQVRAIGSVAWESYVFGATPTGDAGALPTTAWQTVVCTFNQNVALETWVDGASGGSTATSGTFWAGGDRWIIGMNNGGGAAFDGQVAWAAMYPRVLGAGEIKTLSEYHPRYVPRARWLVDLIGATPRIHTDKLTASVVGTLTASKDNPRLLA